MKNDFLRFVIHYHLILGFWFVLMVLAILSCNISPGKSPEANTENPDSIAIPETKPPLSGQKPEPDNQVEAWFEDSCEESQFNPSTGFETLQIPALDEPAPRVPFHDPVYGSCLVRVTDRSSDPVPSDPPQGMKNEYSRVQSFNADESQLIAFTTEGNWYLYDARSLTPLGQIPVEQEPRWDAEEPDLLYYTDETRLMSYRISSGEQQVVHEFAEDFPGRSLAAVWTKYEGSPTLDGRYWGLMVEDQEWMTVALLIYDLETDQITAMREIPPSEIDSVSISPLGNYLLAFYDVTCEHGQLGTIDQPCGLMVYDRTLENGRGLLRVIGHSDPVLDSNGHEVIVYQDIDTDRISMLDLASGAITPLFSIDFSHSAIGFHFSGRAFNLPGWALVSTSNGTTPFSSTWMDDQVFALELKQDGRVVRLAHTHSVFDEDIEHDYWAEPHASVNRDFTQIVFTSNWGQAGTDEVDMYMIKLPDDWVSQISSETD
jgi:hypothetical protein